MAPDHPYWSSSVASLMRQLDSRMEGLSSGQARILLQRHGPNAVETEDEYLALTLLLRQVSSPLVLILVFGAIVSLALQDWTNAAIILAIVVGSMALGFSQEYRASRAVARLRRSLALTARVLRDGKLQAIPASKLVPGDIIRLSAGNLVPADGMLIEATDFLVTEASLTGEPFPVQKEPGEVPPDTPVSGRTNCVYSGTSVRSGTATVLIVETGRSTALGAIATSLKANTPETDFVRGIRQFGFLLVRVMLITVIFVLAVNQLMHRPPIESLLFAVALAVGLSPELLPAIVSVTLSHGARAMARRGVIVRRQEAIENLGSMDVLCTDKTGTLTAGVIELNDATDPAGVSDRHVRWLAYLNAAFETGIENPLDEALVAAGDKEKMNTDGLRKIDEIPYDFIRRRLTIVVEETPTQGKHLIITKGAFTNVLDICSSVVSPHGDVPLDDERRAALHDYYEGKGREGFRVLAVATRQVAAREDYGHDDESAMSFAGFLLFFDPLKPRAAKTVHDMAALGIRVKIITGDNRYVAAHVAEGLKLDFESMLTGGEMARLNDESLLYRAERTDLFAEVDPQQKERVVRMLQRAGHVVGYIGDGINDGPPLHVADVGISVDKAVDVAREAADIILLRPDLDVLSNGVKEGRRTFANTLKYIRITTSANFGNMMSMAFATSALDFLPLSAKQILLNNFLSDFPSIAISTDKVDHEQIMHARRWNVNDVRRFMLIFGLVSSAFDLLTFGILIKVFHADERTFQTAWFVVSLMTELMVVLVLRTGKPAWRSRPSRMLLTATVLVVALALWIPYLPFVARVFGFVPLPWQLAVTGILIVLSYIACTEAVKRRFFKMD
ncbi:MAG TPA: magnesium-translocating P-type ATPase [Noviherbaspirillum sp.]|uniref:magnesium-translocating P-type ATPase n=1 Tax=Noviherbaspirillum sp. TaxID=1926288 RepID=UPI002B490406|nr:magnesium-translocating P-type ATPase [Noviherbaspirillum sp.]HJV88646.1 magnesium-translocating P-type ATPase [Noviherbaspirillum sp.]